MKRLFISCLLLALALSATACANRAQQGAGIGAALGGVSGAIIGHQTGNRTAGALIGTGVGAAAGYGVGNEMDKSANERDKALLRDEINTQIINVHNSNGSITPVQIRRQGNVWVGPRGEQYSALPTPEQLRPVYGF